MLLMNNDLQYRIAVQTDLPRIVALLKQNELPVADLVNIPVDFIIATGPNEELAGCIGLERFGADGLLRSFAVDASLRSKTIGNNLFNRLLALCRQTGVHHLHLLTTTAEQYFLKRGFVTASRTDAPAIITSTAEFTSLCPASSVYMALKQLPNPAAEPSIAG